METERKFKWWEYIILKPLRSKTKTDFLTDKDVENVRQLLTNRFASFIEKVQNLDNKPEQSGIIVKAYRNILTSFALALAHPKTDYLAEDGFENLLLLMIEDLSILLGNQKPKFQERVKVLTKDVVKIIYINKSEQNFPPEDPVIFKNLQIGQVRLDLAEKKDPIPKEPTIVSQTKEEAMRGTVINIEQNDIDEVVNNNDSLTKDQIKDKIRASHGLSVKHTNGNEKNINIVGEKEPISIEEAKAKYSNPPVIEEKTKPLVTRKKRGRKKKGLA